MARELGPDSQLNGGSGTEMAPPPKGRRPLATHEAGLSAVFCCPPSSAELSRAQPTPSRRSRAQPNAAEPSRTPRRSCRRRPSAAERESERASELAAPAAEEAPPQGEEVPALRRPPAAEAGPVAPRRERSEERRVGKECKA